MKRKIILLTILLIQLSSFIHAQDKYFVYFTDKKGTLFSVHKPSEFLSSRSINRRSKQHIAVRERDLPVSKTYVDQVLSTGAKIIYTSKWLNAAFIQADPTVFNAVKNLPCIQKDSYLNLRINDDNNDLTLQRRSTKFEVARAFEQSADYGQSLIQNQLMGIDVMHQEGFKGDGLLIGVLDSGFFRADKLTVFDSLFKNNRILYTYDFVKKETFVYEDHTHGTQVLSCLAGYLKGKLIGPAYRANYILFRTEDVATETKKEEIYWLVAAERADSAGVDIITSSLGYTTFDKSSDSYKTTQLDGNTALITKAADYAAATGMLVVIAAGNEGTGFWKKIAFPADADSVLSVGAVNRLGAYVDFSSSGPTADGRIKPDVMAMGSGVTLTDFATGIAIGDGTSFAAPVMCGLAAGLWQAFPNLTNMELLNLIKRSATQYACSNVFMGYGIPSYLKARQLMELGKGQEVGDDDEFHVVAYPNPIHDGTMYIFLNSPCTYDMLQFSIHDVCGKELLSGSINTIGGLKGTLELDTLKYLEPGLYIVRIFSGKKTRAVSKVWKY